MKILTLTCVSDRSEVAFYKGLVQHGYEVINFCDPHDTAFDDLNANGVSTEKLHIKHRFDIQALKKIRQVIHENNFDCIYAPTSRGLTAALRATKNKPVPVVSYRGTLGHLNPWNPIDRLAHLNPRVAKIVANCEAVSKFLHSVGVPTSKLRTVFKGHDLPWYKPKQQIDFNKLGIPSGAFKVACVAKLRPLKGVSYLIRAIDEMVKSDINVHLLLIGEQKDPELPKLVQSLNLSANVHFLGFQHDVAAYLTQCDVSTMVSTRREGVARAIVESMALGVPVVVSDTGGLPEVVEHDSNGLIVPAESTAAITDALSKLYSSENLRSKMSENAKHYFQNKFNLSDYISNMISVLEDARSDFFRFAA